MKNRIILSLLLLSALGYGQEAKDPAFLPPFNFQVDSVSLLATWEAPKIVLLNEDFEDDVFPPAGWADTSLGLGWLCEDDPQYHAWWIVPENTGKMAQVNDDLLPNNDGSLDFLYSPELDLTVADSFMLVFESYFDGAYGQTAFVKYSLDNGETWQELEQMIPSLGWQSMRIDLSAFSGPEGITNLKLAFYTTDRPDNLGWWGSGWAIDNVAVYSDSNPNEVLGYKVFQGSYYSYQVDSTYFQYSFWYGNVIDCGVQALYQDGVSETVWQNVHSYFLLQPDSLTVIAPDNTALLEWNLPPEGGCQPGLIGNRDIGEVISSGPAPDPITSCWGICDDGTNLWITDPDLSPTNIYEVSFDLVATGNVITISEGQSWIGDMVSDCQFLYACLVGGPNSIAKVDLETGETVELIGGAFTVAPQTGLAADFNKEEFYIGGGTSDRIWRTDFSGATISTFPFNNVSGLAFNPGGGPYEQGSLWIIACDAGNLATEVDPDLNWAIIESFEMPGDPFSGAGTEIKRNGFDWGSTLWLCNQIENKIYLVDLMNPGDPPLRNLMGFNVYKNGVFLDYISCTHQNCCQYNDPVDLSEQTVYSYEVTAVYNLSGYCFPVDTGTSLPEGPAELMCGVWNELDFFEDWPLFSNGNLWRFSGDNWKIDPEFGNEAPSAVFSPDSLLLQYKDTLQSFLFITGPTMVVDIILEYDVLLSSVNSSGNEKLQVQVNDLLNGTWNTVKTYDNSQGSFGWQRDTMNITGVFNDGGFRIRFNATGENSSDINYWAVDNIALTRVCPAPESIEADFLPGDSVLVSWEEPTPPISEWKQWDDGVPYTGIGFGTSKESWFNFAIRWTPELLADMKGASITAVGFIPGDVSACFKIALWSGDDSSPFFSQAAGNLNANQWSIFQLDTPQKVDITRDLYVGYRLSTYCDYPISVDDGPAIDSLGNMYRFEPGGPWSTLLEANPEFDWNLNIKAYFERDGVQYESYYKVFRSIDGSEPEMIAETMENEFTDPVSTDTGLYCYKVNALYYDGCESEFSPESCVLLTEITLMEEEENGTVKIYPNPASDVVFIESSERVESVCIYDSKGDKVIRWEGDKGKVGRPGDKETWRIPVNGLAPGIYLVRVIAGEENVSKKIIIMR